MDGLEEAADDDHVNHHSQPVRPRQHLSKTTYSDAPTRSQEKEENGHIEYEFGDPNKLLDGFVSLRLVHTSWAKILGPIYKVYATSYSNSGPKMYRAAIRARRV